VLLSAVNTDSLVRAWLASSRLPAAIGHRREGEDRGEVKREWRREREDTNYGCICVDIGVSVSRSRGGGLISARLSVFSVRQPSALITRSLRRTCRSSACLFDRRVHACVRASERFEVVSWVFGNALQPRGTSQELGLPLVPLVGWLETFAGRRRRAREKGSERERERGGKG